MDDNKLFWKCHRLFTLSNGILIRNTDSGRWKSGQIAGCTSSSHGYKTIQIGKKKYLAHRIIFLMIHKYLPEFIDHIDGNQQNNDITNLRPCTSKQNQYNQKLHKNNKSGLKGVHFCKKDKKWRASIKFGELHYLGSFDCKFEAAKIYDQYAIEFHGDFAVTNKSLGLL